MIKWLFFDLGSTIIDESRCDEYRLRLLAEQSGAPDRGVLEAAMVDFASRNLPHYKKVAEKYGLKASQWPSELEKLYPDAQAVLEELSENYHIGLIANQNPGTEQRLKIWGIRGYFQMILTSADLGIAKPNPMIFQYALTKAQCQADEAVMIGDRLDNDIAPAAALGMKTIWLRQGYGQYGDPSLLKIGPDAVINSLKELPAILQRGSISECSALVDNSPPNATK